MPAPSNLPKLFEEWGGVDLRSNAVNRRVRFAENSLNKIKYLNNSFGTRRGVGLKMGYQGGGGMKKFVFQKQGVRNEKLVSLDDNLWEALDGEMTLNYSGSAVTAEFYFGPSEDPSALSYELILTEDGVVTYSDTIDNGVNQASPYTLQDLSGDIDALTNWSSSYTGPSTVPAAALGYRQQTVDGSSDALTFRYFEEVYSPISTPFSEFWAAKNTDDWQIASLLEHGNRLFIATGYGKLFKYDSVSCYAVGLPLPASHSPVAIAGGALPAATWNTFIDYEFYDALSNYVQSEPTEYAAVTTAAANLQIQHTVANIQSSTGYLTSCAIVAGAQVAANTINVDNGSGGSQTLQVDQTAYFYDAVTGAYIERLVTAATGSTITVNGAPVTVADNAVISANLRINIWRNRNGGSIPYLVATIPNNSFAATQSFTDNIADAALEIEYSEAFENRDVPPEDIRYLTAIQNNVLGATGKEDLVYFTQVDGPEAWSSNLLIRSKSNEAISGLGSNQEIVAVFKKAETHVISGSLDDNKYRQDMLADAIGTEAHHSICDLDGTLWFYSSLYGFRRIRGTNAIDDVGYRVFPGVVAHANSISAKRVVSVVYDQEQLVLFYLPVEDNTGSLIYPNDQSSIFVCDYSRQFEEDNEYDVSGRLVQQLPKTRWWPWSNFNFHGGACVFDNELLFAERRINDSLADIENFVSVYQNTNSINDFCDHATSFPVLYAGGWEDLGEPELLKKWISASIYSFSGQLSDNFVLDCSAETNLISEVSRAFIELTFGEASDSSGWGFFSWGTEAYGDTQDPKQLFPFQPIIARSLRLRFSRDVYRQVPVISGWVFEVTPVFRKHIKNQG